MWISLTGLRVLCFPGDHSDSSVPQRRRSRPPDAPSGARSSSPPGRRHQRRSGGDGAHLLRAHRLGPPGATGHSAPVATGRPRRLRHQVHPGRVRERNGAADAAQ